MYQLQRINTGRDYKIGTPTLKPVEKIQDAAATPEQKVKTALALLGKANKTAKEMRALILGLEAVMFSMPGHLLAEDFKTTHHFSPDVYMRELFIPKGTLVIGKIHKYEHHNILSQGKITVWTEDGMKTLSASTVIKSKPGIKRIGYAHADSIWITVHPNPTNEQDVSKIEDMILAKNFEEIFGPEEIIAIEGGK